MNKGKLYFQLSLTPLVFYPIPAHKQAAYKNWNGLNFPITEQIHQEVLSLPIGSHLTNVEVRNIAYII